MYFLHDLRVLGSALFLVSIGFILSPAHTVAQTSEIEVAILRLPTLSESSNVITVWVSLSTPPSAPFAVDFITILPLVDLGAGRGPAAPGLDYVETAGTLVFQPGQTQLSFPITVIDDDIDETTEAIGVLVRPQTSFVSVGRVIDISDDDPAPIAVPDVGFVNEQEGAIVHVPVKLQGRSDFDILIDWTTQDASNGSFAQALPPADYIPSSGTLRIPARSSVGVIDIPIRGDAAPEADELIVVSFRNPRGATLGGFLGLGFGVILDAR
jgi:hypothetical protein